MKTAVLISGQARTFSQCHPTQHWSVYRHLEEPHFFILWQNDPRAVAGIELLSQKYGADRIHAKLIDDPKDLPMIPAIAGFHAPYQNAAPHPQLLMQHWYQNELWKFYKSKEPNPETVIRMRGDNWFHSFQAPTAIWGCHTPWWGRFGGVNDRFAIMPSGDAERYFTIYDKIPELLKEGCPFHPESLLRACLPATHRDTMLAEFSTLRLDGSMRRYESEVQPADTANLLAAR